MPALRFDGVDDRLRWTTLASALANVSDGAWTTAVLFRRAATNGAQPLEGLGYLLSGTGNGTAAAGLSILESDDTLAVDVGSGAVGGPTVTSTTETYIGVASKGAGSVAPIISRYSKSANTWAHNTGSAALADRPAATMLEIGSWQGAFDFFNGWVGVVAFWEGALSQANKESLATNWRTSDFWSNPHGQPAFLTQLNVAAASAVDLAGNATGNPSTIVGTTLDSAETLASFNFNGTGATSSQMLLPDADLATAGWSTAPLFSKLNDESDSTVISATCS